MIFIQDEWSHIHVFLFIFRSFIYQNMESGERDDFVDESITEKDSSFSSGQMSDSAENSFLVQGVNKESNVTNTWFDIR